MGRIGRTDHVCYHFAAPLQQDAHTSQRIPIVIKAAVIGDLFVRPAVLEQVLRKHLTPMAGEVAVTSCELGYPIEPNRSDDHHDWIIHAASIASPIYYRKYPIETMDANVNGLRRLLDHCARRSPHAGAPIRASCSTRRRRSTATRHRRTSRLPRPTAATSAAPGPRLLRRVEALRRDPVRDFAQRHGLPVTSARPFNNYGRV